MSELSEKDVVNEAIARALNRHGDAVPESVVISIAYSAAHDVIELTKFNEGAISND